jgi:hypothetical protein
MSQSKVISIVPRLPPSIDGVGDYAITLARQLRAAFGVETVFLVVDVQARLSPDIEGFSIRQLATHSPEALVSALCQGGELIHNVLVQYANYGYDRWGCPFWLIKGLQRWKQTALDATKLVTMFHELHNNTVGPPWKHGFWAVPQQKKLAGQLATLSDHSITNAERYRKFLMSWSEKNNIFACPVFSNIAELIVFKPLSERARRLVVFGQRRRSKAYTQSIDHINQICRDLSIEKILDIGPKLDMEISNLVDIPVEILGECSSSEISEIMLNSWVGFLNYSNDPITKSGVFATYCAHGMIPIVHNADISTSDNLMMGTTYWDLDRQSIGDNLSELNLEIARNAHDWYQQHNVKQHGKIFYDLFSS